MARVSTNRSQNRYPVGTGQRQLSGGEISALTADPAAGFVKTLGLISAAEGRRIMKADEEAQYIEGVAGMERLLNETFDTFDTNPNEADYKPAYDSVVKSFDGLIKGYSNKNAQSRLKLHIKKNAPNWENSVNDATLDRKRENSYARVENSIAGIKDLNLADVDDLADANKRVENGGAVMGSLGHTPEQVKKWKRENYENIKTQSIYNQAQNISATQGYEKAKEWVMKQKIDVDAKKGIISDINFEASQQKLEYDKYVEKTEQDFLGKLRQEQLTEDEIMASTLEVRRKEKWLGDIDAQAKERLEGKPTTDYETFDSISDMIDDYVDSERDPSKREEIEQAISDAIKSKKIPVSGEAGNAITLRSRLSTMSDPSDIMSRSDVVGGMNTLKELKKLDIASATATAEGTDREKGQQVLDAHYKWQKKFNEYEKEIREGKDLTAEDVEKITQRMTQQQAEETAQGWLNKYWGGYYRYISGYEAYTRIREKIKPKVGEEDLTNLTDDELEAIIKGK